MIIFKPPSSISGDLLHIDFDPAEENLVLSGRVSKQLYLPISKLKERLPGQDLRVYVNMHLGDLSAVVGVFGMEKTEAWSIYSNSTLVDLHFCMGAIIPATAKRWTDPGVVIFLPKSYNHKVTAEHTMEIDVLLNEESYDPSLIVDNPLKYCWALWAPGEEVFHETRV